MQGYHRSEELWFEDGNIVLEAEGPVFKVYRGNLARHSPVFAAMLSFPQAVDAEPAESLDGCPVVHMHDTAEHLRYFMAALNDFGFSERIAQASFEEVDGVLRLAAKYDIAYVRLRATARLRDWYPDTLAAWRLRIERWPRVLTSDNLAALDLARTVDVHICIPAILFCVSGLNVQRILAPDGFDIATQNLGFEARAALAKRLRTVVWRWLYEDVPGCATPLECGRTRAFNALTFENAGLFAQPPRVIFMRPPLIPGLCVICGERASAAVRAGQEQVWDELPAIFGLDGWDALRQESERAA